MVDPQHGEHGVDTQERCPLHQLEGSRVDMDLCEVHLEEDEAITPLPDILVILEVFRDFKQRITNLCYRYKKKIKQRPM